MRGMQDNIRVCAAPKVSQSCVKVPFQPASPQLAMKVTSACARAAQPRKQSAAATVSAAWEGSPPGWRCAEHVILGIVQWLRDLTHGQCNAGLLPFFMVGIGTTFWH